MKRNGKILALFLAVALICGALIVASSAAAEDATVYKATDFEGLTVGQTATASDGTTPTWDNMTFQQGGRAGKVEVVEGSDGNRYAVITQTDKVSTSGPYAWAATGTRPSVTKDENSVVTDFTKATTDISNYKFMKFEVDVMSPTGKFIAGNIDLGARMVDSAGAVNFWYTNATSTIVKFGNDNGGSYIYAGYDSTIKKYVNPYEFTKIELIVENTSTADALGLTTYAYVNGELWFTKVASNVPTADKYFGGRPNASFIEYRINYLTSDDPTQTLGVDNAIWSYVPAGSETTVADLVSYDAENRPAGLVVATVGGVDYNTLEGAIAAADENSTINVLVSKYTPTTVSKNITLNAGTNVLNIVPGDGYALRNKPGLYKVVPSADGITTTKTTTYDGLVGNTASTGNPSGDGYAWSLDGRWGKVEKATGTDSNSYLVYTNTDKVGTSTPYFGTGYGGAGTTKRPTVSGGTLQYDGSIEYYPYLVFDFDVMSPSGKFAPVNVNMQTRFMNTSSSLDAGTHSSNAYAVQFLGDENGSYISNGSNQIYVNPYEFTHVTIIYEGVLTSTSASYKSHVYVNGEYCYTVADKDNSSAAYYGGIVHLTWDEVRMNLGTAGTATDGRQIAFDNVVTRLLTTEYNGNIATVIANKSDLSAWESNIYDPDFIPAGVPVAQIGDIQYTSLTAAIEAAKTGDTIEILKDIPSCMVGEVGKEITINSNSHSVTLKGMGDYAMVEKDGVYTFAQRAFEYVSGGETLFAGLGTSLSTVFSAADAGSTIKFLLDYSDSGSITINKAITIDLNGKTLNVTQTGGKTGSTYFKVTTTAGFTLTSSVEGAKIFAGATTSGGNPVINTGANNVVINIKGNDAEGNTTLRMYCPTIVQAWSNSCTLNIDGGEYYRTRPDNSGFVQLQGDLQFTAENALFYDASGCIFHFYGRYAAAADTITSNASVDNCVIIGKVATYSFKELEFIITNSYIHGSIPATGVYSGETAGYITLGEGNCIEGTLSDNVVLADGLNIYDYSNKYSTTLKYNTYTVTDGAFADSSFVINEYPKTYTFSKVVAAKDPMLANYYEYTKGGAKTYATEDALLSDVIADADAGTTVKLLNDITVTQIGAAVGISKGITVDLGGFTMTVKMLGTTNTMYSIKTTSEVRFKNGTIISEATEGANVGKSFALFSAGANGCNFVLEDITAYTGMMLQSTVNGTVNVTIEGGKHYTTLATHNLIGGYIESRSNINFVANNALFYCGSSAATLFSSMNYKVTTGTMASTFTFNNCDLIGATEEKNLVTVYNGNTKMYFNSCNIFGSINPSKHGFDSTAAEIADGTIILGTGTMINAETLSSAVTVESGSALSAANVNATYDLMINTGTIADGTYAINAETVNVNFNQGVFADLPDTILTYVKSGTTTAIATGETINISAIISAADANSTITFYEDCTVDLDTFINIGKNLTFDFNGHVVIFAQANKDAGAAGYGSFTVSGGKTVTMKNGTAIAQYKVAAKNDGTVLTGKSYSLFYLTNSSVVLNFDNMTTYTGMLALNYSGHNAKININGGTHYTIFPSTDVGSGFVESRTNVTFTANNASFYIGGAESYHLFTSQHYKASAGSIAQSALLSTFTYNNCKIIAPDASHNVILYANNYTKAYFNGCDIFGSINPKLGGTDSTSTNYVFDLPLAGSIVLGAGTRILGTANLSNAVKVANGVTFTQVDKTTAGIKIALVTGTVCDGNFAISAETTASYYYTFVATRPSSYTVTWYEADGKTVIKTETVSYGATVTPPEYTPSITDYNGWYKTSGYSGWATTIGGAKTTSFTVTGDVCFYPAPSASLEAYLSGAKYNVSLLGDIVINFYIPVAPDGITVKSVTDGDGNVLYATRVLVGGVEHDHYVIGAVHANELTSGKTVKVSFSVGTTALSQTVSLSPSGYSTVILKDSAKASPSYPASAHTMVANLVRYSNNLAKYVSGGTGNATLEALLETYGSLCTTLPTSMTSEQETSNLSGYISSATFDVTTYQPRYLFNFNTSASEKVVDISVTMTGYLPKNINGANMGNITYRASSVEYISGTEYLSKAYIENIPMYNFANTITINIVLENGMSKSGTYNLGAYYTYQSNNSAGALLLDLVASLKVFGDSAASYRYADDKVTAENAVTFYKCDHASAESITLVAENELIPFSAPAKYCKECNSYLISYADFGAVGDGVSNGLNDDGTSNASGTNDFAAIREAHTTANAIANARPNDRIVVVGKGTEGNTFYMGMPDDDGANAIRIDTDVDWNGTHFIIDDTQVSNLDRTSASYAAYIQSIFLVASEDSGKSTNISDKIPAGLAAGATNIGYAPGRPLMLKLNNYSARHYIRYGANMNQGAVQTEYIIVDANGNVDPTTPIQWDYTNSDYCKYNYTIESGKGYVITFCTPVDSNSDGKCDTCSTAITNSFRAYSYEIDDAPILINGLDKDGNINCIWESLTNKNVATDKYDQVQRNIEISRANVTIQGIYRDFVEDDSAYVDKNDGTPRQTYAAYISVSLAYNTTIQDMSVYSHLGHDDDNGVTLGSYEFGGANSINTSWIRCVERNFFKAGGNGKITYRGMFGSNFLRNSYLEGCILDSFDSHSGAYNVTLENCTFEHINFVGGGDAIMRNVTVYVDGGYAACILRSDYGSMWAGNVKMDGVTLRHSSSYGKTYIDLVRAHYTNWYFGFDTELPTKIYANNVKIEQYTRTSETYTHTNGIIDESNTTANKKTLGIFNMLNGELTNDYDYSTVNANNRDPKKCTEAVYLTNINGATVSYPDHWFFDDMKVYKDGAEQSWFTVRSGLHTDTGTINDGICDTCGMTGLCTNHNTKGNKTTCGTCGATVLNGSCVAEGTLITLADGTTKPVEEIKEDDLILVFNHFTGEYEPSYIVFYEANGTAEYNVINLKFSDGTVVRLVYEHALFDVDLNKYVYFTEESYSDYVGHSFVVLKDGKNETVTLTDAYITTEITGCYSITTAGQFNYYIDGLLSIPGGIEGIFNIFEYGENFAFDEELMQADIEKYGLYTYEDFAPYITPEIWEHFEIPAIYFKVAVGKGLVTFDEIVGYIESFL